MIVDSYYVTYEYLNALNGHTSIAYIDDNNAFTYPVDVVIASGIWFDFTTYKKQYKETNTKLLLCAQLPKGYGCGCCNVQ